MPIHTSLDLQGSDSRDWSIRPRKYFRDPDGCRQAICFPIALPVRYQADGASGWGAIVNISSRGALFTTERALALDSCVEVYIKWPVLLHNSVQLSLIALGTIIRVEPGRAALEIERYEFRTCVPSFFENSQPCLLPDRAAPVRTPERTLPERRPARQAGGGHEISKTSQQRKDEVNNARWDRIFEEKFADPEYYRTRLLPHSSPTG
jgi:hypothetical protein